MSSMIAKLINEIIKNPQISGLFSFVANAWAGEIAVKLPAALIERIKTENTVAGELIDCLQASLEEFCKYHDWEYDPNAIIETFVPENKWEKVNTEHDLQCILQVAVGPSYDLVMEEENTCSKWLDLFFEHATRSKELKDYILLRCGYDIQSKISALISEIKDLNTIYKETLSTIAASRINVNNVVSNVKKRLLQSSILPWLANSEKYERLFPRLYVEPSLKKGTREIPHSELDKYQTDNIAILGNAGAGKTTLFINYFLFREKQQKFMYLTAKEALEKLSDGMTYLEKICDSLPGCDIPSLTFLVDGLDEEFLNDYKGYCDFFVLVKRLSESYSCFFWLACRNELFNQYRGESSQFVTQELIINEWTADQAQSYIMKYAEITGTHGLANNIRAIVGREEWYNEYIRNPFQVALMVYLASVDSPVPKKISNIYELYDQFFTVWFNREVSRGTTEANVKNDLYPRLQRIAKAVYENFEIKMESIDRNSAISALVVKKESHKGNSIVALYHRSFVSFLLADQIYDAMLKYPENEQLPVLFSMHIHDDVTNFIGSRNQTITSQQKSEIETNLITLYNKAKSDLSQASSLSIMEKCIYHLTRLDNNGLDEQVDAFLLKEISSNLINPYMRLSLAYGCSLSEKNDIRMYALKYAKSLFKDSDDALINRSWTLVYYGDVIGDPYNYKDISKCSWEKARQARIKRFTKESPRLKDFRFMMFDIPLMYSFFKDRNWKNLNEDEYEIINKIIFPQEVFLPRELIFLNKAKQKLLEEYRRKLFGSI